MGGPGRRAARGGLTVWSTAAVAPEDQLDRVAAKRVLRRSIAAGPARPARRRPVGSAHRRLDAVHAGGPDPRAVRHRPRAHARRWTSAAVNIAVVAYRGHRDRRTSSGGPSSSRSTAPARASSETCGSRSFGHLLRQSMSFYDRQKAGVLVSRLTSDIDSMGELVQFGLLQFVSASLLLVFTLVLLFLMSVQLTMVCLVALPIIVFASSASSAARTPRTSTCGIGSARTCRRCRSRSPACG